MLECVGTFYMVNNHSYHACLTQNSLSFFGREPYKGGPPQPPPLTITTTFFLYKMKTLEPSFKSNSSFGYLPLYNMHNMDGFQLQWPLQNSTVHSIDPREWLWILTTRRWCTTFMHKKERHLVLLKSQLLSKKSLGNILPPDSENNNYFFLFCHVGLRK